MPNEGPRGRAMPRIAGRTDGPSSPFLLITGSVGYDWPVRPGLLGRTAGRAYSGRRNGPSFTSTRVASPLALSHRHCWLRWPLECWAGQGAASAQPPPAWGLGVLEGSVQERPGGPGDPAWAAGGQGDARTLGAQPRAEASWKPLPAGLKPAGPTGLGRRVFRPWPQMWALGLARASGLRTPGTARSLRCLRAPTASSSVQRLQTPAGAPSGSRGPTAQHSLWLAGVG